MDEKKTQFIEALKKGRGIIAEACRQTGASRTLFYKWCRADDDFNQRAQDVIEDQIDRVEGKLLENIEANDTTSIIFYLRTKGKKRGWTDRDNAPEPTTPQAEPTPPAHADASEGTPGDVAKRIEYKKNYIVRLLKKEGKYTAELSMQAKIVAQLLVRTDMMAEEIFSEKHKPVNVEISREGNERMSVNPKEKLYMELLDHSQRALRALGMNTDSRERKTQDDGLNDFMNQFKDNDE